MSLEQHLSQNGYGTDDDGDDDDGKVRRGVFGAIATPAWAKAPVQNATHPCSDAQSAAAMQGCPANPLAYRRPVAATTPPRFRRMRIDSHRDHRGLSVDPHPWRSALTSTMVVAKQRLRNENNTSPIISVPKCPCSTFTFKFHNKQPYHSVKPGGALTHMQVALVPGISPG